TQGLCHNHALPTHGQARSMLARSPSSSYLLEQETLLNPGVSQDRKNNRESWNKQGPNDQYKFYLVNAHDSKLNKEGPDF
ncbi:hypothetical protein Celaphus_00008208, partial [Cervus elaphus hippelaphus]